MTAPDPLAEAVRLVAALRPCWSRPERFHEAKAEALAAIRAAAMPCAACPASALRERLARAHALIRAAAATVAHYRRLLASAARPKPRRRRCFVRLMVSRSP